MKKRNRIGAGRIGSCRIGVIKNARIGGQAIEGGSGTTATPLLLDTYTGAVAVWSFRPLRTLYSGAAWRVRESDGDTESDIDPGDESALSAHVLTNDGFLVTAYDHSGNGYDVTQSIAAEQRQCASSGTLIKIGGIVSLQGTNETHRGPVASESQIFTANMYALIIMKSSQASGFVSLGNVVKEYYSLAIHDGSAAAINAFAGTPTYRKNGAVLSPQPTTRDDMHTQFATGAVVAMAASALNFDDGNDKWSDIRPYGYAATTSFNPNANTIYGDCILFDNPSSGTMNGLENAALASYGG